MKPYSSVLAFALLVFVTAAFAEKRFDRPVIKLAKPTEYTFIKLDDVQIPSLTKGDVTVSCLTYRGTKHYYVEIGIINSTKEDLVVPVDLVDFNKPNYTVMRADPRTAAAELESFTHTRFVPTAPPVVPPSGSTTTINANATTYGNQTQINGTATTVNDNSGQAGANFGNALGNAIAARRFQHVQASAERFAAFLETFSQNVQAPVVRAGEAKIFVATFDQLKPKKAPFTVTIRVAGQDFIFQYAE